MCTHSKQVLKTNEFKECSGKLYNAVLIIDCNHAILQIPLGVLLHNENKLDEMGKILESLMTFVPALPAEGELTLPNGARIEFDNTAFTKILLGGDQLTVARVRGTQALRQSEDKAADRLEGIIPVCEDWHVRMSLMKVLLLYIVCLINYIYSMFPSRPFGRGYILCGQVLRKVQCTSSGT